MSWLIRESFGIAAGFVLNNGWIVTNFLGLVVLLNIFVMVHVIAALMSFRMVALLPHHLPRLIGFTAANRVDMEGFYQQAAWGPGAGLAADTQKAITAGGRALRERTNLLRGGPAAYIAGPEGSPSSGEGGMDSTLRATTDTGEKGEDDV